MANQSAKAREEVGEATASTQNELCGYASPGLILLISGRVLHFSAVE